MADVNVKSESDVTKAEPLWPVRLVRGLIADNVPARLGQDAFTLAVVLVNAQDRVPGRRAIGFWRDQLCDLCGIPRTNPRRIQNAQTALMTDGWLNRKSPANGDRKQSIYSMTLKPVGTLNVAGTTPSHHGENTPGVAIDPAQIDRDPAQFDELPGANQHSDPAHRCATSIPVISIPVISIPVSSIPITLPPPALERDVFTLKNHNLVQRTQTRTSVAAEVGTIFSAYPRQIAKRQAEKAIIKALQTVPFAALLKKVLAYSAAVKLAQTDRQFIPHPSTWFNQGRWDDDPNEWARSPSASQHKGRPSLAGGPGQVYDPEAAANHPNHGEF